MKQLINKPINEWISLPTSSSKSAPDVIGFYDFYVKTSSRYSLVHIWPTSSSKIALRPSVLCTRVLRTFCRQLLQIEACARGNRHPTHGSYFTRKKHRVSRPRVFSSLSSGVPELLHFPTTWWWCGWHDDVVNMMVRMLAMTLVHNSEVSN